MKITYERIYYSAIEPKNAADVPRELRAEAERTVPMLLPSRTHVFTCTDMLRGLFRGPCQQSTGWRVTFTPFTDTETHNSSDGSLGSGNPKDLIEDLLRAWLFGREAAKAEAVSVRPKPDRREHV